MRCTNNNHILCYDWCGMEANIGSIKIYDLIEVLLEIDHTVSAKFWNEISSKSIQGNKLVARSHIEHSGVLTITALPECQPAPRQLSGRISRAQALCKAKAPKNFAIGGVQCHHAAARSGCRVEHTINHQGRGLKAVFGVGTEIVSLKYPSQFQIGEIGRVDLLQGRIACVPKIASVGGPLS